MFLELLLTLSESDPGKELSLGWSLATSPGASCSLAVGRGGSGQSRPELTRGDLYPPTSQLLQPGSTGHSKPFPVKEHFRGFFL